MKIIEIKEFDKITSTDYGVDTINDLITFIEEYETNEDQDNIIKFLNYSHKGGGIKEISVKNFVGNIQLKNGVQIDILPKIEFGYDNDVADTKRVFLKMLRSLKQFNGKNLGTSNLAIERMNLYEIFINMYLNEVKSLVKSGLKSNYILLEDNIQRFKGKLLVKQNMINNVANNAKFYVAFDEFSLNTSENKLIKSTLLKLLRTSDSYDNIRECKQLLNYFDNIDVSQNINSDFSKIKIDRNTKQYEIILNWSKIFLLNKSFSTFSGSTSSRSLLFPMELIFQEYVSNKVREIFYDWEVTTQGEVKYLFDNPAKFMLKPDILISKDEDGHKIKIILDTKWKRLNNNPSKNYGISSADMYQMFAYAMKHKVKDIWLLYPENEEMNMKKQQVISYKSSSNGFDIKINVFFVDLKEETNIKELKSKIEKNGI